MERKILNEFRQDLVSGDWVLFATGRAKRPGPDIEQVFGKQGRKGPLTISGSGVSTKSNFGIGTAKCPFDDPIASGQEIIKLYPSEKDWQIAVIKNKYPALVYGVCEAPRQQGPFRVAEASGFHEVVITRDHNKNLQDFSEIETLEVLKVFKDRYQTIASEFCGQYILIFHNFGLQAGGSVQHPHSQIMATPILPPDVMNSVVGAEKFYLKNNRKVHEVLMNWELEQKTRIVNENESFIALCPFVSKKPYEVRIFPKNMSSQFEVTNGNELENLAAILNSVLRKLKKVLNNPSYNFFIHSAPIKVLDAVGMGVEQYYTWHMEIFPHTSTVGGFELGTGMDINIIDPDKAASELRNADL
ncbi:MAG: hypothetical protein HYX21_04090 [Candidatus Yanofskybacteria bacterium]|nr:hypothetical protein [Candidatus Yanofskybacteria bacterium]